MKRSAIQIAVCSLVSVAMSTITCFAQPPQLVTLSDLLSGPQVFIIPEVSPEPTLTVIIPGVAFSPFPTGVLGGEINMFDVPGGPLSDKVLFENAGPGGSAQITFLSDDDPGGLSILPIYPPLLPPQGEVAIITLPVFNLFNGNVYSLTALMESDSDNDPTLLPGDLSDRLTLSLTVPEPTTFGLAGVSLVAMLGLIFRRGRIAKGS